MRAAAMDPHSLHLPSLVRLRVYVVRTHRFVKHKLACGSGCNVVWEACKRLAVLAASKPRELSVPATR